MHHTSTYLLEQVQRILKKCFFWNCGHKNNPSKLPALLMWTLPDLTYLSDPDSIIVSFCASVSQSPKNVLHKIFQNSYMDLLQLLHGFVNVVTWICHVVTSISHPLPNQNNLKFGQGCEACWFFCVCWVSYWHQFPVRQFKPFPKFVFCLSKYWREFVIIYYYHRLLIELKHSTSF